MPRFLTSAAVASLTLHFFVTCSYSLLATNSSCGASGAAGCSCQDSSCELEGLLPGYFENGRCTEASECYDRGSLTEQELRDVVQNGREILAGSNVKVCDDTGPLTGGGCNHGSSGFCKEQLTMRCHVDGECASTVSPVEGHSISICDEVN